MRPQKPTRLHKIIMDNSLVKVLNSHIDEYAPLVELSKTEVVVSALTLSQQWSLPKEECAPQLHFTGRPCGESCVCYTHALVNAALEVLTDGPKSVEAALFLEHEYLCNAENPKILH